MKLLFCPNCQDVRKIGGPPMYDEREQRSNIQAETVYCRCHKSWGVYVDNLNAVYGGDAVMLGFSNSSLGMALTDQDAFGDKSTGLGRIFEAFIIPESAPTVRREK